MTNRKTLSERCLIDLHQRRRVLENRIKRNRVIITTDIDKITDIDKRILIIESNNA